MLFSILGYLSFFINDHDLTTWLLILSYLEQIIPLIADIYIIV